MLMIGPNGKEEVPDSLVREREIQGWWKLPAVTEGPSEGQTMAVWGEPVVTVQVPIHGSLGDPDE